MKNKKMKGMLAAVAAILSLHMGTLYAAEGVPASLDADTLEYDMRIALADVVLVLEPAVDAVRRERVVTARELAAAVDDDVVILLREIVDLLT